RIRDSCAILNPSLMSDLVNEFSINLRQVKDYEFLVKFDKETMPDLLTDETVPIGREHGPSPTRLLAAALGNCLAASFLFASRKAAAPLGEISATVKTQLVRNEQRRMRIGKIEVVIDPGLSAEQVEKAMGPRGIFEEFCTVTQSVRAGIPIEVKVKG